jgi:hypothetical protein
MNASFFDYDRDGDLDIFLITNPADEMVSGINIIRDRSVQGESRGTDILYRNNGDQTFTDVSREAGILIEGYSLGAAISDFNNDGWPDIYVSNDFLTSDILYINNRNGTFSDELGQRLRHTSFASMGNDVADFNNDGTPDIFVLDMLPEDNYRKKIIIPPSSYDKFQLALAKGYTPAYSRNTLQLNNGDGTFSDVAFLSGVSSTDWSWSALWGDYDNDGDKDLMVTNGFYRDLGNLDYINYQARLHNPMGNAAAKKEEKLKAIHALRKIPLSDYLFENNGDLTFRKRSAEWGFTRPGFSNGACYADLDNDGDLDLAINQFNSEATVYQNRSDRLLSNHYLRLQLKGKAPNRQAIGARVYVYSLQKVQMAEFNPYRGFESTVEPYLHFGLGKDTRIDSLLINWPDGTFQRVVPNRVDTLLEIAYAPQAGTIRPTFNSLITFPELSQALGIRYKHEENEFVDFKVQPLLPHLHSQAGPGVAVGDLNADGREDFFVGGASGSPGTFFIQQRDGRFQKKELNKEHAEEDMGALFFDADGDRDLDLYVVSGGSENAEGSEAQQDRLYINNGKGEFTSATLPDTKTSGSCVVAADYDRDGDMDLFVGGRVSPGRYPLPCRSYLLRNDTRKPDQPVFTDVTPELLQKPGMVCSALFSDVDTDGWIDLLLVGEFMPIRFFRNNQGTFTDQTNTAGLEQTSGWWNAIAGADIDHDGDIDYVVGNLGLNSRHKASPKQPLCIYAKDFDKNGRIDPLLCSFVQGKNYLYPTRDEMIKQINSIRLRFPTYETYASATFEESFTKDELQDAYLVKAVCFESSVLLNQGNGHFIRKPLPLSAQWSPLYGLQFFDVDADGYDDLILAGNDFATEPSTGRYDAFQGTILMNDRKGNFQEYTKYARALSMVKDSKGMALLFGNEAQPYLIIANNNDSLKVYALASDGGQALYLPEGTAAVVVKEHSGPAYRWELHNGGNYLSSGSHKFYFRKQVAFLSVVDRKGNVREMVIPKP